MFCTGTDSDERPLFFECELNLKLNGTSFGQESIFWISNLNVVSYKDQLNIKLNLHPQLENRYKLKSNIQFIQNNQFEVFSIHFDGSLEEYGLGIKSHNCWSKLIIFFSNLKKNNLKQKKTHRKVVKTLAKLKVF